MDKYVLDGQYGKYLEMHGISLREVLRSAGIPEDLFSRKRPVLDEADYYRFMDTVGKQIHDPEIPIKIASADNVETFSPPVFAAYCSKNGLTFVKRLSHYKRIIAPMKYEVIEDDDLVKITLSTSNAALELPQFLVETEMVFMVYILRTATKEPVIPVAVRMTEPVTDPAFEAFTGCPAGRDETNTIVFTAKDMALPFISCNEGMWEFFEPELQKRLYELEKDDTFAAAVRSALTELLPGGAGSADEVAQKLGVSKRTLQRKLTDEGTNFQKQLNGVRELLAKHYIKNTDMSSDNIAFLLGYQEINSFLRAFSLWTGMTVTEYRNRYVK